MARALKLEQIDNEEQLMVRLVFACEIEGLTQAEAARRFGITRLRVNKTLNDARRLGILKVSVDSAYAASAELEWKVQKTFDLGCAVVVPSPMDDASVTALVAAGLGGHLTHLLAGRDITRFGVSWGNTMNLALRHMQPLERPDLEILSIMGGMVRGSDMNEYEITSRLSTLCNAKHSFLPAPLYASDAESRSMLMKQEVIAAILDKMRSCQAVAMAAGDLDRSLLVRHAMPQDIDLDGLIRQGAVGDILGYVLDGDGRLIENEINYRVVGMTLDDLASVPNVILAAGGLSKVRVIRSALKMGFVNTLVTDERTATELLLQA